VQSLQLFDARLGSVEDRGAEQRALFRRWPAGVSIVVAEVDGRRAALTVSSLVSLSLEPPLVGISIALQASLHELLRAADEWTASILAGNQDYLAQHFARSVPPIALWNGIPVREDDPRLLTGAAGWLVARTVAEHRTGDHTFFVGEVVRIEQGPAVDSLTYIHHTYKSV
jgi:flavin reductase (DIM6/NTAB) family NADH-FMN oxidoreductase RutF